jgi:hypothetical protein
MGRYFLEKAVDNDLDDTSNLWTASPRIVETVPSMARGPALRLFWSRPIFRYKKSEARGQYTSSGFTLF